MYTLNIYKLFTFDISSGPSKTLKSKISHIEQVFSAFPVRYNLWEINHVFCEQYKLGMSGVGLMKAMLYYIFQTMCHGGS